MEMKEDEDVKLNISDLIKKDQLNKREKHTKFETEILRKKWNEAITSNEFHFPIIITISKRERFCEMSDDGPISHSIETIKRLLEKIMREMDQGAYTFTIDKTSETQSGDVRLDIIHSKIVSKPVEEPASNSYVCNIS